MSFIGKKIGDVLPGIERAKVLLEREYEVTDAATGRGIGSRVRYRLLDVDGNGRGDVMVSRHMENGRYKDSFSLDNDPTTRDGMTMAFQGTRPAPIERNALSRHDRTTFETDEAGTIRMEHHWDYANAEQRNFVVADTNGDGKIDEHTVTTQTGGLRHLKDTDFDGRLDREITFKGPKTEKKDVQIDPFFVDER